MYKWGNGVTQDYKQAFYWYQKSADQGYDFAQRNLGLMYEEGKGVVQSDILALEWYRKAAEQGNKNAKNSVKSLELKISNKSAQKDLQISEQETFLTKAQKELAEIKNKEEESKIKEEEFKNIQQIAEAESDRKIEVEFWASIKESNDPDEYQIYLEEFPLGKFIKLAQLRIKKLSSPSITSDQKSFPKLDYGSYHALVIGNDKYKHLASLSNAVNDANDVASLLRSKYQFNVNVLTNATRDEIVSALSELRNSVSEKDNILIYYAGHGYLDKEMDEGFWLPVDATDDNQVHWVANDTIMRSVRAMKAKHVMIVADSCFSGTLTRGIKIANKSSDYMKEIVKKKARTVLTSGGLEPVSDVGGGNNSVFAESFLKILKGNQGVMNGNELFIEVRKQVMQNTKDQTPEYADIRKAGHDGGDFLFVSQ